MLCAIALFISGDFTGGGKPDPVILVGHVAKDKLGKFLGNFLQVFFFLFLSLPFLNQ